MKKRILTTSVMTLGALLATGAGTSVSAQTEGGNTTKVATDAPKLYKVVTNKEVQDSVAEAKRLNDPNLEIIEQPDIVAKVTSESEIASKEAEIKNQLATIAQLNNGSLDDYNRIGNHNASERERVAKEEEEIKKQFPLIAEKDGVRVYGRYNESARGSQDYYKDIHVFTDDQTVTALADGVGMRSDSQIVAMNAEAKVAHHESDTSGNEYDLGEEGKSPVGGTYKVTHVANTVDGRQIDAVFTVKDFDIRSRDVNFLKEWVARRLQSTNPDLAREAKRTHLGFYNNVNYAGEFGFYSSDVEGVTLDFKLVDPDGNTINPILAMVHTDIDYKQGISVTNTDKIVDLIPSDSGLQKGDITVNGQVQKDVVYETEGNAYDNASSIPKGSYVSIIKGGSFTWRHDGSENGTATTGDAYKSYIKSSDDYRDLTMYADILGKGAKVNLHVPKIFTPPIYEIKNRKGVIEIDPQNIQTEKHAYNTDGVKVDGKSLRKGSEIHYGVTADYGMYKDIKKPEGTFTPAIIDDIPEELVTLTDYNKVVAGGKDITAEMERKVYNSIDEAPEYIKEVAKDQVTGKFVAWTPKDVDAYTSNYILKGIDVTAYIGAKPNDDVVGKTIVNKGMQIEFKGLRGALPVDNKVVEPKPTKSVKKNGTDINEQTLLQGTVFNYEFKWSLADYKNLALPDAKSINLFAFMDDIQDDALELTDTPITIKDGDTDISDKFNIVKTSDGSLGEFKDVLGDNKIEGKGFAIIAKDTTAFLRDYVLAGKDLTITVEAKVTKDFDGTFENEGKQIDFDNKGVTVTNKVTNKTPELKPVKDVRVGDKSVDGSEIDLDAEFNYVLTAEIMKADVIGDIKSVTLVDDYNEEFDELTNKYVVTAKTDIKLKDGTVIKAGEDITKHGPFKAENGVLTATFAEEFVTSIVDHQDVSVDVSVGMKRIKAGEKIENTYNLFVNEHKVVSNTVVTSTKPKPEEPQKPLPNTGTVQLGVGVTLLAVVSLIGGGFLFFGKRNKSN